MYEQVHEN